MSVAAILVMVGGGIFLILGVAHNLFTLMDLARPRYLTPADDDVRLAMRKTTVRMTQGRTTVWNAWLGFNLSHGLGLMLSGGLALAVVFFDGGAFLTPPAALGLAALAGIYLVLSLRFFFHKPVIGAALAIGCFLVAALLLPPG